jgi:ribonuclease HII
MTSKPTDDIEYSLLNEGYDYVIGVDESGRGSGSLAVVAAAVIIPKGFNTTDINDSKKLSSKKREEIAERIKNECIYSIAEVDEKTIDRINILEATKLAMRKAINSINIEGKVIAIIDGNFIPKLVKYECKSIVKGDSLSISIAAASILAKTYRDALVLEKHKEFPIYGWDKNKTYLTKQHREAIKLYGPCKYHRKSFTLI